MSAVVIDAKARALALRKEITARLATLSPTITR